MIRPSWTLVLLAVAGLSAAVLTASPSVAAAPAAGPCLPPGIPVPPGANIPRCPKPGSASNLRVKVDGSVTVVYALHSEYWGQCNAAHGGGSHTDASTELNFGTPAPDRGNRHYRTEAQARKRPCPPSRPSPTSRRPMIPKQDQRHEVAPGCGVVKDQTNCTASKGPGGATVHLSDQPTSRG